MNKDFLVIELIEILMTVRKGNESVRGAFVGGGLYPIYSVSFDRGVVKLTMLHKAPWINAEKSVPYLLQVLNEFTLVPEKFPNGNSRVLLSLETNLYDYETVVNYYSIADFQYDGHHFLMVAGAEEVALRTMHPPDPYLLEMQKKEPSNPFYFPFRAGID